jgi:hypothetical protein
MTEGKIPKGDPEPPDNEDGTAAVHSSKETNDEAEVQAYEQPASMEAQEAAAPSEIGDPEPPDTDTSS